MKKQLLYGLSALIGFVFLSSASFSTNLQLTTDSVHEDRDWTGNFSSYYPSGYKHNSEPSIPNGPINFDFSSYHPNDYIHNNGEVNYSRMVPSNWVHNSDHGSPNYSALEPPTDGKKISRIYSSTAQGLDVYPNPARNNVTISPIFIPEFVAQIEVRLTAIDGKQVFSEVVSNLEGNQLQLDVTALPAGVYSGSVLMGGSVVNTFRVTKR